MPLANAGFGVGHDNWKFGDTSPREKEGRKRMTMN
tara:strand:+ start:221 stop:325 length:105 start_codon:yes stop_codon:yes gene_type:complete